MKISIITTSFNMEKTIEETIQSVLSQKGDFELEYIITDGASKDHTMDIVKKYEDKIKWISEKDKGQSDGINKGLKLATGDILAFLNADDLYLEGCLQQVFEAFKDPKVMWCYGRCRIIDEKGNEIRKLITFYKNILLKINKPFFLFSENYISQPAVFWRKEVWNKIGVFNENEHYCMDYDYWLRTCNQFGIGKNIDKYLACFRFFRGSKSGNVTSKQFDDDLRIAKTHGSKNHPFSIFLHYINFVKIIIIYKLMFFLSNIFK